MKLDRDVAEQFFEMAATILIVLDTEGHIKRINKRGCDILGYDREELVGEDWFDIVVPDDTEVEFDDVFDPLLSGDRERIDVHENQVVTKSGERRTINWHNSLIYDQSDSVTGLLGSGSDITERKRTERRLHRYRQTVESSPIMLDALDADSNFLFANPAYRDFHGIDLEEDITGLSQEAVHGDAWEAEIKPYADRVQEGETIQYEMTRTNADGDKRTLDVRYYPLRDDSGEIVGNVAAMRDITERKANERELRKQNERLDEFASIISHDLRNPLNVAKGRAKLVTEACANPHTDPLLDALNRMEEIVEETLILARNGETVGETERIEVGTVVKNSWEMVTTEQATLEIEDEIVIQGDPDRLRHLFENLIRNAIEHGGDSVTVRIGHADPDILYVEDDGTGIPETERENVFDPVYSSTSNGSGFGLPIVKRIAEAHRWDVSIGESESGGVRFEFEGVEFHRGN